MNTVVVQKWEESERGWGVRPDGYTLHKSMADRDAFVEAFWKDQKKLLGEEVPDEYTRVSGEPYLADVSDEVFARIEGGGDWRYDEAPERK